MALGDILVQMGVVQFNRRFGFKMDIGDVVTTKSIKVLFDGALAKGYLNYKADKEKVLVFMFMGTEDEAPDGEKINGDELFDLMGWKKK
jgi:hypothetical protein